MSMGRRVRRHVALLGLTAVVGLSVALPAWAASVPKEVQQFYEKKDYPNTLQAVAKLPSDQAALPDVRRIKIRALLKQGRPKEALEEYDKLEASLKQDDLPLLRDVALGFIVAMMKDMREQMRGAAYTALKEVESDEVVPLFEDGLSDGSGPVRVLAVEGLGRSAAGRRSPKLRSALEDQAGLVKARVIKVLGKSGDPAVLPLVEAATRDELNTVRIAAYASLVRLGRKDAWEQLARAAEAPNPEDRAEAIRLMADLEDPRGAALMSALLNYTQPSVRGAAARGLGHLRRKEARRAVEALLQDPIPGVRESAATSLADMGAVESVPLLTEALKDGALTVRAAAIGALLQLGQPFESVAPTVRGLVYQNDTGARAAAAQALGKATAENRAGAIAFLTTLLADPLPGPKIVAVRSLGHIGDREVLHALKEALHDQNEAVQATAGGALVHILQRKNSRWQGP